MNSRIFCTVLLLLGFACRNDEAFKEMPPVPEDVFNIELCPALVNNITALFPESKNNQAKYAQLFSADVQQRIILTKDADVYVSFVTEAAAFGNVLGYYVYNSSTPPGSPEDIEKQLIFPNVDNSYLSTGDTRRLGTTQLKAGTVVGFFLIVGGYRNDGVYFKRPTFYTDYAWNADRTKQHVLCEEKECKSIVIGFEDKTIDLADKDYNDIIFTVSDNIHKQENTSFDLQKVVVLSN